MVGVSQLCYEEPVCFLSCEQCDLLLHFFWHRFCCSKPVLFPISNHALIKVSLPEGEKRGLEAHTLIHCLPGDREAGYLFYNESDRTTYFKYMRQQNGKSQQWHYFFLHVSSFGSFACYSMMIHNPVKSEINLGIQLKWYYGYYCTPRKPQSLNTHPVLRSQYRKIFNAGI